MEDHKREHVLREKGRVGRLSLIREIVLGAQDGLIVPLGVVSSVAGAFLNNNIIIIAGIAESLAGALSMGTGVFLSSQAESQVHAMEIRKERQAIEKYPEQEKDELAFLFEKEGLKKPDARSVVDLLFKSRKAFINTHIQKELGLEPEPPGTPIRDALYVGSSYIVVSMVPLFPYFLMPAREAVPISIICTLLALFSLGLLKAQFTGLSYIKSGFQVFLIGTLSGVGGYILGNYLPHLLGIR